MEYRKKLTIDDLEGCKAADLAKAAGKAEPFMEAVDRLNRDYVQPGIGSAIELVDRNRNYLLHQIGLDHDGQPLKTKKYRVRYHVVCTTEQEVEAISPDDAREKADQLVWEDSDACALYVYRDDIQSIVPVSCRVDGRLEEVEYDAGPANRTKWLEDRLAEAVNLLAQIRDGESADDVTASRSEKDTGKDVGQFVAEVRAVYPCM